MKKPFKKVLFLTLLAMTVTACQTSGQLQPVSQVKHGVAKEGSLANTQLTADTTKALESLPSGQNVAHNARIRKFVIQKPVGSPGAREWREMWVVESEGEPKGYLITFRESGMNSADFQIEFMH